MLCVCLSFSLFSSLTMKNSQIYHGFAAWLSCHSFTDGYSTIDHRDKERKYKTNDTIGDASEKEPLKVSFQLFQRLLNAITEWDIQCQAARNMCRKYTAGACKWLSIKAPFRKWSLVSLKWKQILLSNKRATAGDGFISWYVLKFL